MKPETVVGVWVAVLLMCLMGLIGPQLPWPAGLRESWHPGDYAAWVQAVGSVAAIAAGAIAIRWQVAQEARREAVREIKDALQEVTQIHALVAGALEHAKADRLSCNSAATHEARARELQSGNDKYGMTIAFQEAHLDQIRSMKVRLTFISARLAYAAGLDCFATFRSERPPGTHVDDLAKKFDDQLTLLAEAARQLDQEAATLRARLQAELAY